MLISPKKPHHGGIKQAPKAGSRHYHRLIYQIIAHLRRID